MSRYPRCTAICKDGNPCEAFAKAGSHFCAAHDPESNAYRSIHAIPTLERKRADLIAHRAKVIADMDRRLTELDQAIAERRVTADTLGVTRYGAGAGDDVTPPCRMQSRCYRLTVEGA